MQFQQVILIAAAAVLALVAVAAAQNLVGRHPDRPEPNANICPGKHTPDTCKVCCKSFHYLQSEVTDFESYACVCNSYYNTGSHFFGAKFFEDPLLAQKLQKPYDGLDEDLALKRKSLKTKVEKAKLYSNIDASKVPAQTEIVDEMEALVEQAKTLGLEYYNLSQN